MLEYLGKSIFEQRKKRGWTQEELAEKLDVSAMAVSKWERGISVPEIGVVCKLSDRFQVSVDELLGRKNCLLDEEDKYSDKAMKQFDYDARKNIIDKYESKTCIVDIMEELANIDDDTIQLIMKELNNTTLLYALAGASGKVCRRFLENMSGRMLYFLEQYIWKENFSLEKIEIAQKVVVQIYSIVKQ